MLAYFLKVNVAIVLFYAFYRLFFYKDTFFGWRRTALLCFFAVSAAVPLLNIQTWITEQEPMVAMADLYASVVLPELTIGTEAAPTDWKSILSEYANIAYWGIVALLMIRLIMQLAGIIHLACRCRKVQIGNTNIHLLPKADGPFSFFHWIFIHPSSHTEEEFNEILTHEQTHARQWHSIDVIISELVCIFCWCNPFAWLMKREIRTNMEFIGKNIKYPVAAQKAKIQGRVVIQFIVDKEGNIICPRVIRGADPLLDAEAIRLTTIMPKWKPGMQRGQAVNVKYTVPIMFRLQEPEKSLAVQNATVTPTK